MSFNMNLLGVNSEDMSYNMDLFLGVNFEDMSFNIELVGVNFEDIMNLFMRVNFEDMNFNIDLFWGRIF